MPEDLSVYQKEIIKKASQRILKKIKNPQEDHNVDAEIVEILTAISNIGMITDDSKRFTDFSNDWKSLIEYALIDPMHNTPSQKNPDR